MKRPTRKGIDLSMSRDGRSWKYFAIRGLWACVQLPFFPKMPKYLSGVRIGLLRLFGAQIGRGCSVAGGTRVWVSCHLKMGDHAVIGEGVRVYNLAPVSIGSNAVVSQYTHLCSATHDYTDPAFRLQFTPITIHSSAWIAANVFVSPGVTVGRGAVIGACSVVTKEVPAWMICVGNPCRPIKPRILNDAIDEVSTTG